MHLRIPLRQPFVTAKGTWHDHDAWLVRLRDVDGRIGTAEATLGPGASSAAVATLAGRIRAVAAYEVMGTALVDGGWRGWSDTTAGPRPSVPVNGTIAVESTDACVSAARELVAAGFGTLKLKVGGESSTTELVARIRLVREAVGPAVKLRLDANGVWDGAVARQRLDALAGFDLEYVEQPIAVGPPEELARLRADVVVPIAADELVSGEHAAQLLLDAGAVDVLVIKPARVGIPTDCLRLAEQATAAGVGVVISTLLETGVGIGTALAIAARLPASAREYAHGLATSGLLESDLLLEPLATSGGRMMVPTGTGMAGRLDLDAVRRYAVEWMGEPW